MRKADGGTGAADGEPGIADARILGQLLAAQNLVPVLPTTQHVADFYARALASIPGVGGTRVCLAGCVSEGAALASACGECERARGEPPTSEPARPFTCALGDAAGFRVVVLGTEDLRYGYFVLQVLDPARFEPYHPFIRNLGNFLALSLENRRQRESLLLARDALERRVVQRTDALTAANRKLAAEIEERRRAEAAIRELNEDLSRALAESDDLYQNAPCGYHSLGPDGTYVRINDTELRWLGRTREEVTGGLRFPDVLAPSSREAFDRNFAALKERGALHDIEYVLVRKDGSELPVLLSATAVRDGDGRFVMSRATMYDLSEHRRADRALRESEERFRQSQKLEAIGRLAGGVAHDFNNLLTVILSCSGSLLELLPPADPRRVEAEEITEAARKAAQLTRQLLAFGRRQASAPVPLDAGEVVAGMESLLRRLIGEDVTLEVVRAPDTGRVRADAGQLEQVILNLAVNARDAMPHGGRVRLETGELDLEDPAAAARLGVAPGRWVTLAVRDEGTGLSPEARAHLFEPFFTTKAQGKGTGLGLATVYGIVKQAGGEVRVESELGVGSTFLVLLPRIEEAAAPAAPAAPAGPDAAVPRGTETVLLVEDDARVRSSTARALRAAGYTVLEAADGEEALERATAAPSLDVLVTDVVMPRLGGPALAPRIRALRGRVRVLFVSGYAEEGLLQRELAEGDTAILWKPFTSAALARAVRALLDGELRSPAPG